MIVENDHNVYIIGAGFSAAAGLPTMPTFFSKLREAHPWLASQGRAAERDAVERVLSFRLGAAPAAYHVNLDLDNIEDLFSLATAQEQSIDPNVRVAIAATLEFSAVGCRQQFRSIAVHKGHGIVLPQLNSRDTSFGRDTWDVYRAEFYETMIAALTGRLLPHRLSASTKNTFISFNYDQLVEDALQGIKEPYSLGFPSGSVDYDERSMYCVDSSKTQLLKMHGSVNWLRNSPDGRLRVLPKYAPTTTECPPEIIPPTAKKLASRDIGHVWNAAVAALTTASRIIVIGYSFPIADAQFRYLVAAGLQSNISLRQLYAVNPDTHEFGPRIGSMFRKDSRALRELSWRTDKLEAVGLAPDFLSSIGRTTADAAVAINIG